MLTCQCRRRQHVKKEFMGIIYLQGFALSHRQKIYLQCIPFLGQKKTLNKQKQKSCYQKKKNLKRKLDDVELFPFYTFNSAFKEKFAEYNWFKKCSHFVQEHSIPFRLDCNGLLSTDDW